MTMPEVIEFISRFATVSNAPVRTNTNVTSVTRTDDGYHIATTNGDIRCRCVVLASGACNLPSVPALRAAVPASVEQITPFDYHDPSQLPDGGALVVGASATGVQLAARDSPLGATGDARSRGARPPAAQVPRTRCAVVDGSGRACGISRTTRSTI